MPGRWHVAAATHHACKGGRLSRAAASTPHPHRAPAPSAAAPSPPTRAPAAAAAAASAASSASAHAHWLCSSCSRAARRCLPRPHARCPARPGAARSTQSFHCSRLPHFWRLTGAALGKSLSARSDCLALYRSSPSSLLPSHGPARARSTMITRDQPARPETGRGRAGGGAPARGRARLVQRWQVQGGPVRRGRRV